MPTTAPSFVGLVVSVEITTTATGNLDDSEVDELESIVAQAYGVDPDDVTSVTEYVTTGTMTVSIPDSVSEDDALAALTSEMASTLGVSEDSITLSLDSETGEVTYSITTTDYDETAAALATLQDSDVVDNLATDSGVTVTNVTPSDDIVAEVNVVVNADEVTVPLQQAENQVDALLGEDYNSDTEGKLFCMIV